MQTERSHSGDLSQESGRGHAHPSRVSPMDALAPSARGGRRFYNMLSASSVGLELGISVLIGLLGGLWADGRWGTAPWLMLAGLALGLVAGFRAVLRAVRRADRADGAE
jgi:F0F1-type ATP synthase assembly protein I